MKKLNLTRHIGLAAAALVPTRDQGAPSGAPAIRTGMQAQLPHSDDDILWERPTLMPGIVPSVFALPDKNGGIECDVLRPTPADVVGTPEEVSAYAGSLGVRGRDYYQLLNATIGAVPLVQVLNSPVPGVNAPVLGVIMTFAFPPLPAAGIGRQNVAITGAFFDIATPMLAPGITFQVQRRNSALTAVVACIFHQRDANASGKPIPAALQAQPIGGANPLTITTTGTAGVTIEVEPIDPGMKLQQVLRSLTSVWGK